MLRIDRRRGKQDQPVSVKRSRGPGRSRKNDPAGNAGAACAVPPEAQLEDVSQPDRVVGYGSPESCTADAFVSAVASGGKITFDCGPSPVTITLDRPAKVFNDAAP